VSAIPTIPCMTVWPRRGRTFRPSRRPGGIGRSSSRDRHVSIGRGGEPFVMTGLSRSTKRARAHVLAHWRRQRFETMARTTTPEMAMPAPRGGVERLTFGGHSLSRAARGFFGGRATARRGRSPSCASQRQFSRQVRCAAGARNGSGPDDCCRSRHDLYSADQCRWPPAGNRWCSTWKLRPPRYQPSSTSWARSPRGSQLMLARRFRRVAA